MRRSALPFALCAAAILLCAQQCCALRAPKQITLDANGCQGLQWNALVSCMAVAASTNNHDLAAMLRLTWPCS